MKELPKAYEPGQYEDTIYKRWEDSGFFNPDVCVEAGVVPADAETYTIMMPPPNVTGILHLGHALENTLMDVVIRHQRMLGKRALLVPGTDHAAVATQAKVESMLVADGMTHPREELGREGLLEKIRTFSEQSKATILSQVRKMGTSADWSRLAYTFDESRSKAVNDVFKRMYDDGLIYRGYRVVNWSVKGQSTASEAEIEYIERKGMLYTFKYSDDFPFTIATTRPETKVGDTAVAVHPEDDRYKEYIGQTFDVTFCGVDLKIKVIADEHVDPTFGTGALGVTPAHSSVDFDMYERHNATGDTVKLIQVIGTDGNMTDAAGAYAGLGTLEARAQIVDQLKADGLMVSEEEIDQNVGTSDRFKDVIESLPMTQWFVAVNKEIPGRGTSLRQLVEDAVATGHNGDPNQQINLMPEGQVKRHTDRIENLHDWCISRQIWWGHRIPVWYKGEEVHVGTESPGDGWTQDEDTLDTWFSSGMWSFSALGWPNLPDDVQAFHPTQFMQMGHEILFLWFQRMVMMSTYALDEIPFKDVYIHGLVQNEEGKKFSKSDGNTADPIDVIATYGTDALRYSLIAGISAGNDQRFYNEKIESSRNLVNKLWNMSRFMLMSIENPQIDITAPAAQTLADQFILTKLDELIEEVTGHFQAFRYSLAATRLTEFTRDDLADWYLEIAKVEDRSTSSGPGSKSSILNYILNTLLKLWHPYVPFVTEAIWQEVYGADAMLMVADWPTVEIDSQVDVSDFDVLRSIITGIRALRAEKGVEPAKKVDVYMRSKEHRAFVGENVEVIKALARLETLTLTDTIDQTDQYVGFVEDGIEVYIDLAGAVDIEKEKERLQKEIDHITPYIKQLEAKLAGPFAQNAPEAVVAGEQEKLADAKEKIATLDAQLTAL
jgi:valyl-tRNA synthetase